ncbi:hypothetical protein [Neisseria sp.]|uniref:hypothetical protein n=1 Tax=Neisseria sp. TaxID=192066 RepID=UPI0026DD4638|nr:hypothetical protein [Neisseria sp.]MDO4907905.1 hypothetical protein [Neisseria sp.]
MWCKTHNSGQQCATNLAFGKAGKYNGRKQLFITVYPFGKHLLPLVSRAFFLPGGFSGGSIRQIWKKPGSHCSKFKQRLKHNPPNPHKTGFISNK